MYEFQVKKLKKSDEEEIPGMISQDIAVASIFSYLGKYDSTKFLQNLFSAIADNEQEYQRLWDRYFNEFGFN